MLRQDGEYKIMSFAISETKNGDTMAKLQLKDMQSNETFNCVIWQDFLEKIEKRALRVGNLIAVIDSDYNEKFNNEKITDASGRTIGKFTNDRIYDAFGRTIGKINGERVKDASGRTVGRINDDKLKDASGRTIARISDDRLKDASGRTIARVNGLSKLQIAVYFYFFR